MTDRQAEALEALQHIRSLFYSAPHEPDPLPSSQKTVNAINTIHEALKRQQGIIKSYENLAFRFGAMLDPPCFRCGYDGAGYFQPDTHPCAERHHELYRWRKYPAEPERDG